MKKLIFLTLLLLSCFTSNLFAQKWSNWVTLNNNKGISAAISFLIRNGKKGDISYWRTSNNTYVQGGSLFFSFDYIDDKGNSQTETAGTMIDLSKTGVVKDLGYLFVCNGGSITNIRVTSIYLPNDNNAAVNNNNSTNVNNGNSAYGNNNDSYNNDNNSSSNRPLNFGTRQVNNNYNSNTNAAITKYNTAMNRLNNQLQTSQTIYNAFTGTLQQLQQLHDEKAQQEQQEREEEQQRQQARLEEQQREQAARQAAYEAEIRREQALIASKSSFIAGLQNGTFHTAYGGSEQKAIIFWYPNQITANAQPFYCSGFIPVYPYVDGTFPLKEKIYALCRPSVPQELRNNASMSYTIIYPVKDEADLQSKLLAIQQSCQNLNLQYQAVSMPAIGKEAGEPANSMQADFWGNPIKTAGKTPAPAKVTQKKQAGKDDFWNN